MSPKASKGVVAYGPGSVVGGVVVVYFSGTTKAVVPWVSCHVCGDSPGHPDPPHERPLCAETTINGIMMRKCVHHHFAWVAYISLVLVMTWGVHGGGLERASVGCWWVVHGQLMGCPWAPHA